MSNVLQGFRENAVSGITYMVAQHIDEAFVLVVRIGRGAVKALISNKHGSDTYDSHFWIGEVTPKDKDAYESYNDSFHVHWEIGDAAKGREAILGKFDPEEPTALIPFMPIDPEFMILVEEMVEEQVFFNNLLPELIAYHYPESL